MTDDRIVRLNALARKHKDGGLDEAETAERASLRAEYLASFRQSLTSHLDHIYYVDEQGNKEKLRRKDEE